MRIKNIIIKHGFSIQISKLHQIESYTFNQGNDIKDVKDELTCGVHPLRTISFIIPWILRIIFVVYTLILVHIPYTRCFLKQLLTTFNNFLVIIIIIGSSAIDALWFYTIALSQEWMYSKIYVCMYSISQF